MTPTCPRCGSVDLHSSRSKGVGDALVRALGMPPRRCSACGWRGYRPRVLCPAKHGSQPELPAVAAPPPEPISAPDPVPPPAEKAKRRGHRKHQRHLKGPKVAAWKIAALAVGLGGLLGYVVIGVGR